MIKNASHRRTLVFGVIVLFLIVGIYPASAIDTDKESNHPIPDEYEEIITFIKGYALLNWIDRKGYFRGEVNITLSAMISQIKLSGFRRSQGGIEHFDETVDYVHVYSFIGYSTDYSYSEFAPTIIGIAIGNIEWE